ncbi:uncharacterized proline-rich protein-like [Rhipicephalus sanguineus]|uniref:uncharacterized proline-rich protein-like n=1 Tax=Rhipicephalus sanguineus TaxID=34632 RepID=UPI0020C45208|nr:uncharacterized proline-rich protein-like [Rhipicephalus sanguineus]
MGCDEADSPPPPPPSPSPPPGTPGPNVPPPPQGLPARKPRQDRVRAQIDAFLGHLKSTEESREKWRKECQSMEEEELMTEERQHQELLCVVRQLTTAVTRLLPQGASMDGEEM